MVETIYALKERLRQQVPDLIQLPDGVWRRTGALNTWGTNAIEGNTLTYSEVQQLVLDGRSIAGRPVPDVIETLQHDATFRGLLERIHEPVALLTVLEMHEGVFRGSPRHRPGEWRRSNVFIAGAPHRPPNWTKVVPQMERWAAMMAEPPEGGDDFLWAAKRHQLFEEIHPFEDGNGRIGRLALNLGLMRRGWPPLHITPDDRDAYLSALVAGNHGDHAPLALFLRGAMERSLLDLLDQVGSEEDTLTDLRELAAAPWCPHGAPYLALRCRQGALAGLHATQTGAPESLRRRAGRPRWLTSRFALRHYLERMRGT